MQRRLILDSIENIRDLGGHPTHDGQHTRWKAFLRADHFQPWSEATQQALVDYGVTLVIDLRLPHEIKEMPNAFTDSRHVEYRNIPLLTAEVHSSSDYQLIDKNRQDNAELYLYMLDECQDQIRSILAALASNETGTSLFHCFAGKDRTGVIAALLLSLVQTRHDAIVHDYALTADYLAERMTKIRAHAASMGEDLERLDILFASKPSSMEATLKHLNVHHHGGEAYMRACGMEESDITRLRGRLLS